MIRVLKIRRGKNRSGVRGAIQMEFVLSFILVLLAVFAFMEVCMAVYTMNVLGDAAREGVRYAIVHGFNTDSAHCSGPGGTPAACTDAAGDNVVAVVRDYARFSLHDTSAMSVTVNYLDGTIDPTTLGTQPRVQVVVSYSYVPWISAPWAPTLRSTAEGRIVN